MSSFERSSPTSPCPPRDHSKAPRVKQQTEHSAEHGRKLPTLLHAGWVGIREEKPAAAEDRVKGVVEDVGNLLM